MNIQLSNDVLRSFRPTPFAPDGGWLEHEILRLVWDAKCDGITHADLYRLLQRSERECGAAVLKLIGEGRLQSVRVLQWADNSWPPMKLFLPEYSPLRFAR
ncbi:MAG: hypothetical protein HQL60_07810 [Magnetococcales bacterium]|nr:hypothetical protein [Magnetococcales bacterium]